MYLNYPQCSNPKKSNWKKCICLVICHYNLWANTRWYCMSWFWGLVWLFPVLFCRFYFHVSCSVLHFLSLHVFPKFLIAFIWFTFPSSVFPPWCILVCVLFLSFHIYAPVLFGSSLVLFFFLFISCFVACLCLSLLKLAFVFQPVCLAVITFGSFLLNPLHGGSWRTWLNRMWIKHIVWWLFNNEDNTPMIPH